MTTPLNTFDAAILRGVFGAARSAGVARYAGNKRFLRQLHRAGLTGHKAYLHVVQLTTGARIACVQFTRPQKGGFQAHSTVPVGNDVPVGAWAITPNAVQPCRIKGGAQ